MPRSGRGVSNLAQQTSVKVAKITIIILCVPNTLQFHTFAVQQAVPSSRFIGKESPGNTEHHTS